MQIVPELEIKKGMCVHGNTVGNIEQTMLIEKPLEVAERWVLAGAQRLHIVDVDGVVTKKPQNINVVRKIRQAFPDIIIQLQGGIHDEDSIIVALDSGIDFVVLCSKFAKQAHNLSCLCMEFPDQIMVSMDTQNGKMRTFNGNHMDAEQVADKISDAGASGIFYTDIPSQGHVTVDNIYRAAQVARHTDIPVFANGGIRNLDELQTCCATDISQLAGIVIGTPLYNTHLDLSQAIQTISAPAPVTQAV